MYSAFQSYKDLIENLFYDFLEANKIPKKIFFNNFRAVGKDNDV